LINWIVDTNIISEQNKRNPNNNVIDWLGRIPFTSVFTTEVTLAEIRYGIAIQNNPVKAAGLQIWLDQMVRQTFFGRVLTVDENVIVQWRILSGKVQQQRKPTPPVDLLIAALAIENTCGIATGDFEPFLATGIPIYNPFTGERFNGA
jgi:toxin FitB